MTDTALFDRTDAACQIRRTLLAYPEASDSGDLTGVGRFMDGVRFGAYERSDSELASRTQEEATEMYGKSVIYYDDGISHAKHLITNVDIAFGSDETAAARSTYVVIQGRPGFPLQVICTGGYQDTFEESAGAWRHLTRREWMEIKGDLSHHVHDPARIHVGPGPKQPVASGIWATGREPGQVSLEASNRTAAAVEKIRRIILTYPERVDRGDFAGVGDLLAGVKFGGASGRRAPAVPDSELQSRTAAEVEEMYRASVILYPDGLPHTKHLITNVDIDLADDLQSARSLCYYTVLQAVGDFPLQIIIAGRYQDEFTQTDGTWKLTARREYSDLVGDLSRHVTPRALQQITH